MLQDRPTVVLISRVGSGKTTLYNKICRENQQTYSGGFSCTRNLFQKCSSYGKGFYIMDTPGFGSDKAVIVHMAGIFAALTGKPLNNILILTKQDRFSNMKRDITENIKFLSRYLEMITVVITHWDMVENDPNKNVEVEKIELAKEVITPLGLKNVIYSGSKTTGKEICKKLDEILIRTKKQKVELTKTEFENQFAGFLTLNQEIEIKTQELEEEYDAKCKAAIHFINSQNEQTSDVAELMHELILTMKEEACATVEEFEKRHGYDCLKLLDQCGNYETAYLTHTKLKNKVLIYLDDVIRRAQNKMTHYPAHIYNFIKQCPNCKLIWLKVSGCGGQTTCGSFPDVDNPEFKPSAKKFKIKITKQIVECIRLKQQSENNQKYSQNSQNLKGCGASLIWDNLPLLSEDIFNEIKNTGILDVLNMNKNGQEAKKSEQDQFWNKIYHEADIQLKNLNNDQILIQKNLQPTTITTPEIVFRNENGNQSNQIQSQVSTANEQRDSKQITLQIDNKLQSQQEKLRQAQQQVKQNQINLQERNLKQASEYQNSKLQQEKQIKNLDLLRIEQTTLEQENDNKKPEVMKKKQNQKVSCSGCIIS